MRDFNRYIVFIFIVVFSQAILAQRCPTGLPALHVGTDGYDIVCNLPGSIEFKITGFEKSSNRQSNYYINFGDGEIIDEVKVGDEMFEYGMTLTNDELKAKNGIIKYTYDKSYCEYGKDKWEIQVRVVGCDESKFQIGSTSLLLQQKGTVDFAPQRSCKLERCFENLSDGFVQHTCSEAKFYEWDFGDGTEIYSQIEDAADEKPVDDIVCHTYPCAGQYNVTLYAYAGYEVDENDKVVGSQCANDFLTKQLTIYPIPELKQKRDINVCKGENVGKLVLEDLDVCEYDWYNPTTKKCEKTDVCSVLGKKVASKFKVDVSGDDIGLQLSGFYNDITEIPAFVAKNESSDVKKATICITPYNEENCEGEPMCYNIIVNPSAKLSDPKNYRYCNDEQTENIKFEATTSDITFEWSVKDGDWAAIGMPSASGGNNIPSFVAKNTRKAPITVTIEVKGNSPTCGNDVTEFTITTYPSPVYTVTYGNPTTCNGTDGWLKVEGLDLSTSRYTLKYTVEDTEYEETFTTVDGSYTLQGLSKGEYKNIQLGATDFGCYAATDDVTLVDPSAPNAPTISSNSPVCIGTDLELKLDNADADITSWKWEGPTCNGTPFSSTQKYPTPVPMEYCLEGDYTLIVERNGCTASSTISVAYREDPEVTLFAIKSVCVNTPFIIDSEVSFNWKTIPVSDQKIKWELIDADGNVVDTKTDIEKPEFTVDKSGYKVKVSVEGFGCNGSKLEAEQPINVKDAEFVLDVVASKDVICKDEAAEFTNNTTTTEDVKYTWTISPSTGFSYENGTSSTSDAPKIKFTEVGNYTITVEADNDCGKQSKTFNIRVHSNPIVTLKDKFEACIGVSRTLLDTEVSYEWNNVEEQKPVWSVSPSTDVTISDVNALYPTFTFNASGNYKIKVEMPDVACGTKSVAEADVAIYDASFDLKVENTDVSVCEQDIVEITNNSDDSQGISYLWSVSDATGAATEGWEYADGNENSKAPKFKFTKEGEYVVKVFAENVCNKKSIEFKVTTYAKVGFALDNLPVACGEYTFDSNSATEGLHITGNTSYIKSVDWVVYKSADNTDSNYQVASSDSYEFLSGDANTIFPIIKIKKLGHYKIELQAKTICNDETVSTKIEIEEPIVITLTKPDPLCANIEDEYGKNPYTLVADPANGVWSWANTMPEDVQGFLDPTNKFFYPNKPGTYTLKYTIEGKACSAEQTMDIVVKDYPTIEAGSDVYVCEKDQTPVLLEGNPNGGVWTGDDVSFDGTNYYYNPSLTAGDYTLVYTITDNFGCKNREYKKAFVQPLPKADFSPVEHCLPDPITFTPVADANTHQFTVDYGDGNKGNSLTHLYDKIGIYDVKLKVSASSGCVDSLTQSVVVEKFPDQEITVDERMACSPLTPKIELKYDYIDPNTTFIWNFGVYGYQYTEQPTPITFEAIKNDTTYYFDVTVKNVCGEYTVKDSVRVLAMPKAQIEPSVERGCSPVEVDFKNVTLGSIKGMKYTWDFGDGSPEEYVFNTSHTFTATMEGDATYTVMLKAENDCGVDITYQDIYVIPPVVFPQIVLKNQTGCVGEEICVSNKTMLVEPNHEILTFNWDFGNGMHSDNPTDTCTVYNSPGEYTIKLTINTSCGSSESDEAKIRIYEEPKFNISVLDYICQNDTLYPKIEALSDIAEVEWDFGTGDVSKLFNPAYCYTTAGEHTITATITENNFAQCSATKTMPLLVRALPDATITPLEADSCSPFTYSPVIEGEGINYTIDYEDNGYRSGNNRFTYVNTSLETAIYHTKIYLEDKFGCKSVKNGVVKVYPEPIASITISEVTEARPEVVTFSNTSLGANNCKWTLPYLGIIETCEDVKEYYHDNVLQTTYLDVANEYGCTDRDSINHQPLIKGLYFPNTFAPNGVTEEVRTFNGVGIGLQSYRLEVFDLYGNLIFYTTSLDEEGSPNEGWDGRDKAGNMMPQDVYTWKAEAVFIDGSVYTFGNDHNNIPGTEVNDVTLHRGSVLLLHR